jgi:predicted ATPase
MTPAVEPTFSDTERLTGMAHEVFISHSSENRLAADRVCAALEAAGIPCWIAPRDISPGTEWMESIVEAIEACRAMVLIVSSKAIDSPQVEREVLRAVNKRIPVVPFRIEQAAFSKAFDYLLSVHHWFDASTPPLDQHLPRLAEVVHRLLREARDRSAHHAEAREPEPLEADERALRDADSDAAARLKERDQPAELPAPVAPESRPNNLPGLPTPTLGREQELSELKTLLAKAEVHLVTLTGPGGTGKSRLGLQAATDLLNHFSGGVYVTFLAPIREPELVVSTIAQTLGVREEGNQDLLESLKKHLHDRQMLLLLDNFEQVMEAGALVADLLESCPRLKVLATSREALHVRGEQAFAVPPLALPPVVDGQRLMVDGPAGSRTGRSPSGPSTINYQPSTLMQYPAVALFVRQAQAARRDFMLTDENARAVAMICSHLDGLPLAIELAAARIKLLPPQAMLGRLENRLKLLTGGSRDLPERHQTLRAAIEWSYDLLDEGEKTLFRRLAVFLRRWTLEAADAICNAAGDLPVDVLDGLGSLVDKSLVRPAALDEEEPRFWMLQTLREYGLEQLAAGGELEATQRAHAEFYLAMAEEAAPKLVGAEQALWLSRLESEYDNCRAALDWSLRAGEAETGLRLGGALWRFWSMWGNVREGYDRLKAVLAMPGASPRTVAERRRSPRLGSERLPKCGGPPRGRPGDCARAGR